MTSPRVLFQNFSLFDAVSGAVADNQSVLVEGDSIAWIGPAAEAPSVADADVRDGEGKTLIPGLINSHVHLMLDADSAGSTGNVSTTSMEWAVVRAQSNAKKLIDSGVTSVRDCGSLEGMAIEFAKIIESGTVPGPRVLAAGRVITMTGGHGHWMGRQADGPWDVARAVRAELHEGADFIKIMATGGVLTQGVTPQQTALQVEELRAAVTEAHNAEKRITSHAIGNQGVRNAITAGLDSLEHACFLDEETIQMALDHGTILVPTLIAVNRIVTNGDKLPDWMYVKALSEAEASETGFGEAVRAGVKIAAGTDSGTPFNPATEMAGELELMVRFGMTPSQAMLAGTRVSAENLGTLDRVGSIEVGKLADLVVIGGNPLDDITALRDIVAVMKGGAFFRDEFTGQGAAA